MNKQEALEALLVRLRAFEEDAREVPNRSLAWARTALRKELEWFTTRSGPLSADDRKHLETIGALVLYLLRDEVEVVEGPDLDAWLAGRQVLGPVSFPAGSLDGKSLGILTGGRLRPVNGTPPRLLPQDGAGSDG